MPGRGSLLSSVTSVRILSSSPATCAPRRRGSGGRTCRGRPSRPSCRAGPGCRRGRGAARSRSAEHRRPAELLGGVPQRQVRRAGSRGPTATRSAPRRRRTARLHPVERLLHGRRADRSGVVKTSLILPSRTSRQIRGAPWRSASSRCARPATPAAHLVDLILDQRDQRRDHHRRPGRTSDGSW